MLTLHLTVDNGQVAIRANEAQSHSFSLHDLRLNDAELKAFVLNPRPYGSRLFQAFFKDGSAAKTAFDELSKQTARTIVLVLDSPELDGVAWEFAYNDIKQEYVVEDCAFIRTLPENERPTNGHLNENVERMSLLFIPGNPLVDLNGEPMRPLDVDGEWREMTRHITASKAPFDLLQLRPATPEQLQTSMAHFLDGLAVHFSGHGAAMKDGTILLFERENGASNPLGAQEFIRAVKDKAGIVFLSACQSAAAEKTEFGNLARGLVKSGVPFALGMQFNLPDPFAPVISGQFYNWLAQGHAIPEATMQARRAVKRENEFFVGMIALYAAHPNETGRLDWRGSGVSLAQTFRPADVSDLPSPASGLIGRQRELMQIGTRLLEDKKPLTVTLHGAGGIGKTALLWQSLLRFAPSFELTLAIALDPLPSLESMLGRLERFLNLPSPCANDTKEREQIVHEKLTGRETLLGLDNFETLNYALNDKGSDEEQTAKSLHSFFKRLAAEGVTLCVTSRDVTNLGGELFIDIEGLPNDVGGRLFHENVVRQKDEIYIEKTQQVSEMVSGHPLALRLLASVFDDQVGTSLDQYIENLQTFLPKAHDKWTEEDRHESLRASFDFTMNNLLKTKEGKELQIALSRLSVFIAFFVDATAAPVLENRVPKDNIEFEQMRPKVNNVLHALWERGLLERLSLMSDVEKIYLYRLHPVLNQFAASILSANDLITVQETHWSAMCELASLSYPTGEDAGIFSSSLMSTIAHIAMPDMLQATKLKRDLGTSDLLLRLAFLDEHFGNLDRAIKLYQQSLEIKESLGDTHGKSVALHQMANVYVTRGDLDRAMKLYQQSLEIKESLGNMEDKSATLHAMANVYVTRGDLDRAMKLYQQSLEIKESLGNQREKSTTLNGMAGIYITHGDLGHAMKLYQQALKINEELGDLDGKASTLKEMAYIHVVRGELNEAIKLYQQALLILENLGDLRGKASTQHAMAYVFNVRGELDSAMKLYQQSLQIEEDLENPKGKSATLVMMANIYVTYDDLDSAMKLYQEALHIAERLGDLDSKAATLNNMARIYDRRGNQDGAMRLYRQALKINESLNDLQGRSATIANMAGIFIARGELDTAMRLYQQALQILESLGNLQDKSAIINNMAHIFVIRGDLDEAMKLYKQSLQIDEGLGRLLGKAATLANMGVVLFQNNRYPEALRSLMDALIIQDRIGAKSDSQSVTNLLIEFRQTLGAEEFDALWRKEIREPIPEWLIQLIQNSKT